MSSSVFQPISPTKPSLVGFTRSQLSQALEGLGLSPPQVKLRTKQMWHWIYHQGVTQFDHMLNISKALRAELSAAYSLDRPEVVAEHISQDGTRKWLLQFPCEQSPSKLAHIECVYIPEAHRGTLCISSQVGCTLNCSFCHTGTQRLVRNLTTQEIVQQIMVARDRLGDFPHMTRLQDGFVPEREEDRVISNIVFMGMGEPLYNFEHVCRAIEILTDGEGLSLSKRRITVSTSGIVPHIPPLGERTGAMLAISLHAVRDGLRDELVPINKKYPIEMLLDACRAYPDLSNARRITFEYVMLKGVNDTPSEARELVRLLKGIPAKINLIPFNPWPGTRYECSDWEMIEKFSDIVFHAGYASPIRTPRGRDIFAACGQLKSETEKRKARARLMIETSL